MLILTVLPLWLASVYAQDTPAPANKEALTSSPDLIKPANSSKQAVEFDGAVSIKLSDENSGELDEAFLTAFRAYWEAFKKKDLITCYQFMIEAYRNEVDIQSYIIQKRIAMQHVQLSKVEKKSEQCAKVRFMFYGSGGEIDNLSLFLRQKWMKNEKNEWKIYENPHEALKSRGFGPAGKANEFPAFPCD